MSGCILLLSKSHSPVFLVNSCLDRFSAPHLSEDPLSRSYRVSLPSSLTVIHSSALVCSTRLRVSVCGTGAAGICLADFLGSMLTRAVAAPRGDWHTVRVGSRCGFACTSLRLRRSTGYSVSPRRCHCSVPASLPAAVPESSPVLPSASPFG